MIKYMSYLYANVRKKWSTYLIPLFGMLMILAVLLPAIVLNDTDRPIIGTTSVFYYFLPFVFGAMFVGTKTLNIFKDGEQDGTELLIVSKPISRGQIVFGKFLTLYSLIVAYALWSFVTTLAISFADTHATTSAIFTFAGGYAIGSLIIMIIFSAVITFFASVLGKIGTMTLSIIVPALLPILSFILVPIGKGTLSTVDGLSDSLINHAVYSTKVEADGRIDAIESANYIYDFADQKYKEQVKTKDDGFYKYVSYFDVWQHMFGFYSVLKPQTLSTSSQGVKLAHDTLVLTKDDGIVLKNTAGAEYLYTPFGRSSGYSIDKILVPSVMNALVELTNKPIDWNNLDKSSFEKFSQDFKTNLLADPILKSQFAKILGTDEGYLDFSGTDNYFSYVAAIEAHKNAIVLDQIAPTTLTQSDPDYRMFSLDQDGNANSVDTLKITKYHSTGAIVGVYAAIAVLLSALVIFRYYRRDFK